MATGSIFEPIYKYMNRADIETITFLIVIFGVVVSLFTRFFRIIYHNIFKYLRKLIKKLCNLILFAFPYRIVNKNKRHYRQHNTVIKITQTMDQYASIYYKWEILKGSKFSEHFDTYEECMHDIKTEYPNIEILETKHEQTQLGFTNTFLYCII